MWSVKSLFEYFQIKVNRIFLSSKGYESTMKESNFTRYFFLILLLTRRWNCKLDITHKSARVATDWRLKRIYKTQLYFGFNTQWPWLLKYSLRTFLLSSPSRATEVLSNDVFSRDSQTWITKACQLKLSIEGYGTSYAW